jgi:CBS domain-containing membrane protein
LIHWRILEWIGKFIPDLPQLGHQERLRACLGTGLGIFFTAFISISVSTPQVGQIWLLAPIGASAIILFTLPTSPLAQPWSIIGGNLICALVGITCSRLIEGPLLCLSTAIFVALALMFVLRCIHPPSGAVALLTILGGDPVKDMGYMFILNPLGLNTLLLITCAIIYNKATGQNYPHSNHRHFFNRALNSTLPTATTLGITAEDLSAALDQSDQLIDVDLGDLENLFLRTEHIALSRRVGIIQCQQIMTHNTATLEFATELNEAWQIIKERNVQALPVLSSGNHLIGIVTRSDFLKEVGLDDFKTFKLRLSAFLKRNSSSYSDKAEVVGQIMRKNPRTVLATSNMLDVVPLMIEQRMRHVPVINEQGVYVGMINQSDMIAGLYQTSLSALAH